MSASEGSPDARALLPRLLTFDQVMAYLGVSRPWLYRAARSGEVPSYKIARSFRFRIEELDAYVQSQRVQPAERPSRG